jgi:hypothetical protein
VIAEHGRVEKRVRYLLKAVRALKAKTSPQRNKETPRREMLGDDFPSSARLPALKYESEHKECRKFSADFYIRVARNQARDTELFEAQQANRSRRDR